MRAFIGLPVLESTAKSIWIQTRELRKASNVYRWASPANYHITLLFLGEISDVELTRIQTILQKLQFPIGGDLSTSSIGGFPNSRKPRTVVSFLRDDLLLCQSLFNQLAALLPEYGGTRKYCSHITIGRLRKGERPFPIECIDIEGVIPVRQLWLFQSIIGRGGARYVPMQKLTLPE